MGDLGALEPLLCQHVNPEPTSHPLTCSHLRPTQGRCLSVVYHKMLQKVCSCFLNIYLPIINVSPPPHDKRIFGHISYALDL